MMDLMRTFLDVFTVSVPYKYIEINDILKCVKSDIFLVETYIHVTACLTVADVPVIATVA